MDPPQEQENICDICGDIGVDNAILTCTLCKVNCEHMYCMRVPLEEAVDDWICEECEFALNPESHESCVPEVVSNVDLVEVGRSGEPPAENSKLQNESRVDSGSGNWEKRVEKGKTKYLSVQEVIKLSFGEKINWRSNSKGPKIGTTNVFERTASRSKTAPMSFSSQQDLASGSSQQPKLHRPGNMEIGRKQVQHSTKLTVPRQVSSPRCSQAPKNIDIQKELQKETQWAQTKARRLVKKQSSIPSLNAPPVTISGGNIHTSNELRINYTENTNIIVLPDLRSHTPALDALWKGSFRIHDDHRQEELNPQIQAHPPSRVLKKIYEFSKKMPQELNFQLVCAETFWSSLFNDEIPDERDIALYFFPGVRRRSKDYVCLLETLSLRDLALRQQIGDVELLVFTSKRLPPNYQCWHGHYFLWGVFHRVKNDTTDKRVVDSSVQPSDEALHGDEEVDMDIDMIGGTEVGRIDIPVARGALIGISTSIKAEATASLGNQPRSAVSRPEVKIEVDEFIPPGFEEVYKQRLLSSSS